MSFVSFKFIVFISTTFVLYFIFPKKYQWFVLLLFSYIYYYLNSKSLILVLIFSSIFTYIMGKLIYKEENNRKKKILEISSIVIILSSLILTKYINFIIENINSIFSRNIENLNLLLPLGISYYTLQAISYIVDIYKGKTDPEENILHFMLYMAYFPQIIQGPIARYNKLAKQFFEEHNFDFIRIMHGLQLMAYGIAKKIILADRLAVPVSYIFNNYKDFNGLFIIFGAACYGFQIYADFSGGIDTIRGISEIFGIDLEINFRQPFFSKSIEEFWRRWHITLGAWMRDYIFYPLTLSKKFNNFGKKVKRILGDFIGKRTAAFISMFIVYLLVGLWHGPEWKYVAYGIWNGIFIMNSLLLENVYKKAKNSMKINDNNKFWKILQIFRTFIIVSIGRIISRSNSLTDAIKMIKLIFYKTFDFSLFNIKTLVLLGLDKANWLLCLVAIIIILFIDYLKEKGIDIRKNIDNKNIVIRWCLYYLLIIAILVFGKYGPGYDAANFIYGNF